MPTIRPTMMVQTIPMIPMVPPSLLSFRALSDPHPQTRHAGAVQRC
jgi:hypothetical protein